MNFPDGEEWVEGVGPAVHFDRELWVEAGAPEGGDGSQAKPFRRIGDALSGIQAGTRVWVKDGIYREKLILPEGGTGPDRMVALEAAPGAQPVLSGWVQWDGEPQRDDSWSFRGKPKSKPVWRLDLRGRIPEGEVSPFAYSLMPAEMTTFGVPWTNEEIRRMQRRRGLLKLGNKILTPVILPPELGASGEPGYWVDDDGMALYLYTGDEAFPAGDIFFTGRDQLFKVGKLGLGWVHLKVLNKCVILYIKIF